ncbi:carboxypeptidase O-like [Rhinoderma darwinii]|uniref:carboxypeptidase O-like n=1 Tax=Rhinoderma darwinii TaxID=43563 RepID=UPI003F681D4B
MKCFSWTICLLGFLLHKAACVKVKYDGDQVLKVTPQTPQQVQYLQELSIQWRLDLWKPDIVQEIYPGIEVHVRVQFSYVQQMKENLVQRNIPFKIMIEDVQKLIDKRSVSTKSTGKISLENYDYNQYHPMDEIYNWMDLIKDKYKDVVEQHILGPTYEGKPINYFKIGWPSNKTKKAIFMDCGIHAREWIAVAYCQWFMREILSRQKTDALIYKLLKQVDFYVIPVLNVDGYVYTWTTERLWRKNRSPQSNGTCFGVDLNRNFDAQWCSVGASTDCDSLIFCGPSAASELETKALVKLFEQVKSNMLMYLTIHSYGQLILLPYGYKQNQSANHNEMERIAKKAAEIMKDKHNTEYFVGSSSVILYYNSGSSADWAADSDIKFSYTFELRDDGEFGFELPADQIAPTCEETLTSMLSLFEYLNTTFLEPLDDLPEDPTEDPPEDSAVTIGSLWINIFLSISVCIFSALSR